MRAVFVILLLTSITQLTHAESSVRFDVPVQSLVDAVRAVAAQSNVNIFLDADIQKRIGDRKSVALKDEMTLDQALTRLLQGSGLTFEFINGNTIAIRALAAQNGARPVAQDANSQSMKLAVVDATQRQSSDPSSGAGASAQRQVKQGDTGAANSSPGIGIDEIVVTAQKREQKLKDVPLSVTAIAGKEIDERGLVSAEDYLRGIPGVNQVDIGYGQSIIIRGIETSPTAQNFGSGTTTATYFGETPTTNSAGLGGGTNVDLKLVDIERVEVLRGPQGTAFGNSSMGGAVRTIPVAPKLGIAEAKVAAGYSATSGSGGDNYEIQAIGNVPLIKDRLAIRATAYKYEDSGFYRNRAGSDPAFQAAVVAPNGAQAYATDSEEVGSSRFIGGRVAALWQATDDLSVRLGYLSQKTETDGFGVATNGTYEQAVLQVAPAHVMRGQKDGVFDTDIDIANAVLEYGFNWADLLATYSYTDSGSRRSLPQTAAGIGAAQSVDSPSDHSENVAEVRLASKFDGPLNFIAGVYHENLDDEIVYDYRTLLVAQGTYRDRRNLEQNALFAEVSWKFLPHFTLTGGSRAYRYDRDVLVDTTGIFGVGSSLSKADASGSIFRGNLSWTPTDEAMVYVNYSEGFRLGKPQPGLAPGQCDLNGDGLVDGSSISIASTRNVESDDVASYELGGKFVLLDRKLTIDVSAYRMDWSGMPALVVSSCAAGSSFLTYLTNVGAAKSEGVELEAQFQIARSLRIDIGGSWVDAELTEDVPRQGFVSGSRLPGSPRANANLGLQYNFAIGGHAAFVRADSIYVGSFYGNVQESFNTKAGDYVKVDATARLQIGNLDLDLFVQNLTNEDAFAFRGVADRGALFGYRLRPREVGLRVGYDFR